LKEIDEEFVGWVWGGLGEGFKSYFKVVSKNNNNNIIVSKEESSKIYLV